MQIRVRGPQGQSTISIDDAATVAELISTIAEKTGLPAFDLKSGFPPKPLDLDQYDNLAVLKDTGLKLNGEQLTAVARDTENISSNSASQASTQSTSGTGSSSGGKSSQSKKLAAENPTSSDRAPSQHRSSPGKRDAASISKDPPQIPVPSHQATMVLRVMPDDNSCMFRAVGSAVFGDDLDTMTELRSIIAQTIQADKERWNEAILGQKPDEYCEWIQMPDSWGGGIELSILSQHFSVEICSVNVKDQRVDRFNEGKNLSRIIVIYSNIHYDTIALSPSEAPYTFSDLPPELDMKQFEAWDDEVIVKAQELCKELAKSNYYFDAVSTTYLCKTCGWKGEYKAMSDHVMKTMHTDMTQVTE